MKYRTTDKEQREHNAIVLGFGYCDIQYLEQYLNPNAYTCGVYGWRADFYELDGFTISTGYDYIDFVYKPRDFADIAQANKMKAELLRKYIKSLNAKLEQGKIKLPADWNSRKARVHKLIANASKRISKKVSLAVYGY